MPKRDDPGGRRGWFLKTRWTPDGGIPPGQVRNASRQPPRRHAAWVHRVLGERLSRLNDGLAEFIRRFLLHVLEVSTDGGRKWNPAEFKGTPQRMAHTRFGYGWNWDGNETEILSRCTDEIGQEQPTREQVAQYWNEPFERNYRVPGLDNSVMPWRIARDGSVTNGLG